MDNKNIKHIGLFVTLSVILLVLIAFFVVSYTHVYDEPIPWPGHGGDEILVEIRNSEMTLQEALSNNDIGTWVNHGSYVSYDGGDVGIGIIPEEKLHVAGRIKAEGFCVGEDCYDMMPMDHAYKPIPSCNENEVVKWNGADWSCELTGTDCSDLIPKKTDKDGDWFFFDALVSTLKFGHGCSRDCHYDNCRVNKRECMSFYCDYSVGLVTKVERKKCCWTTGWDDPEPVDRSDDDDRSEHHTIGDRGSM